MPKGLGPVLIPQHTSKSFFSRSILLLASQIAMSCLVNFHQAFPCLFRVSWGTVSTTYSAVGAPRKSCWRKFHLAL
jgi:hypothetical protein